MFCTFTAIGVTPGPRELVTNPDACAMGSAEVASLCFVTFGSQLQSRQVTLTSVGAIIIIMSPFMSSFPLTKFVASGQQSYGYDDNGNGNWPRLFPVYYRVAGILWVMGTRSDGMMGGSSYLTHVPAPLTYTVPVAFRLFAFDWFRSFFVFHDGRRKVEVSNQLMSLSFICYLFCTSAPPTK